ncbi:uncharacterized protein N7443_001741 [Penicillium atrosanguineum]|uniref:uncharacterized protein n=1 Tax=Penicillium atrosanguineum TaxID=1132637 RepID=UPI00239252E9|nr:uncharacterized protein N7443_001741 [Penicillium atrosanguineum]KAJ5314857.1 hypothetical protein N7443_001741 [Penicillium atrosanguineum]
MWEAFISLKRRTYLEDNQERFRLYGNTLQYKVLGRRIIKTVDPKNIQTILARNFQDYSLANQRQGFLSILGHGIFTTDGQAWSDSRSMLRQNFKGIHERVEMFEPHITKIFNAIPTDGTIVDLQSLFCDLTLDTATEFLFGGSIDSLNMGTGGHREQSFALAFDYCMAQLGNDIRTGRPVWFPDQKLKRYTKVIHRFVDVYVHRALEVSDHSENNIEQKHPVFLHDLAKKTRDPIVLRSEALNILLAGRDTTASLLSNMWHTLANQPDICQKLRSEVDALGGHRPTIQQIKSMEYLRFFINESLRLYPVVPANIRTAVRDTILPVGGGPDGKSPVFVPRGTSVSYHPYALHRREDIFGPDAMEFKPERWKKLRPGWAYIPFNGGPRICLGQQLALAEASYTTIRLLQEFKTIEARGPREWREHLTLTCTSGVGVKVALGR